jgi:hypothetical protein
VRTTARIPRLARSEARQKASAPAGISHRAESQPDSSQAGLIVTALVLVVPGGPRSWRLLPGCRRVMRMRSYNSAVSSLLMPVTAQARTKPSFTGRDAVHTAGQYGPAIAGQRKDGITPHRCGETGPERDRRDGQHHRAASAATTARRSRPSRRRVCVVQIGPSAVPALPWNGLGGLHAAGDLGGASAWAFRHDAGSAPGCQLQLNRYPRPGSVSR